MAWIRVVAEHEARGSLKLQYEKALRRAGKVFNILKVQSLNHVTLDASMQLYLATMRGNSSLSRVDRELLATVVSQVNECFY